MATVTYSGNGHMTIQGPAFNARAFREAFRSHSFPALAKLFARAADPAKEWTESCAALHKLRRHHAEPTTVLHIGDGAHARTAALFAFHTLHTNVSIDPAVNPAVLQEWQDEIGTTVQRLRVVKEKAECVAYYEAQAHYERNQTPVLLTFVHAHVDTERILAMMPAHWWRAAYVSACCHPRTQLVCATSHVAKIVEEGEDWSILSPERTYQVLAPLPALGKAIESESAIETRMRTVRQK